MDQLGRLILIGLAFGMTVFVHEAGHFVAARLSGMAVHEFSIGFGRPLLFWFRRGETQWSFRLWPFFSFVRVAGMEPGDDHPRGFHTKSRAAQAFVLALGCIMNFLLGVGIFIFIGMVIGRPVEVTKTVERVLSATPAEQAGLMPGDRLVGVNGRRGMPLEALQEHIESHAEEPILLEVERGETHMSVVITPKTVEVPELKPADEDAGEEGEGKTELIYRPIGRIGVVFQVEAERLGVWESISAGFIETYGMVHHLILYLIGAVMGKMPLVLMGPVGVAHTLYSEVETGWLSFLATAAALTVGIGFLNLLPIPPLDGSRLVIVGIEAIRRKPFDKRKEVAVHLVGFALLIVLLVVLTYQDILRILTRGS